MAASTASIRAARRPPRSSACRPAIVVPPGLVTWSLSTPGWSPVSRTIRAAPSDGLRGQGGRDLSGQADTHAAVGERLDHHVDERRPAPRQARHGVEQRLGDPERLSDRAQAGEHHRLVRIPGLGTEAEPRRPRTDQGRGVRHHPRQPSVGTQPVGQGRERHPRRDRDHQVLGCVSTGRSCSRTCGMLCGFTARTRTSLTRATSRFDDDRRHPRLRRQGRPGRLERIAGDDRLAARRPRAEHPPDQGRRHPPRADEPPTCRLRRRVRHVSPQNARLNRNRLPIRSCLPRPAIPVHGSSRERGVTFPGYEPWRERRRRTRSILGRRAEATGAVRRALGPFRFPSPVGSPSRLSGGPRICP